MRAIGKGTGSAGPLSYLHKKVSEKRDMIPIVHVLAFAALF